jgi:hypothetical protein
MVICLICLIFDYLLFQCFCVLDWQCFTLFVVFDKCLEVIGNAFKLLIHKIIDDMHLWQQI